MGKYDFVSMLLLNINFKKLYGSIKEIIKYLKKYLSVCQLSCMSRDLLQDILTKRNQN